MENLKRKSSGKEHFLIRILKILRILRKNKCIMGIAELAEMTEMSERNVRRARELLKKSGYNIVSRPGRGGGYRLVEEKLDEKDWAIIEQALTHSPKFIDKIRHISEERV